MLYFAGFPADRVVELWGGGGVRVIDASSERGRLGPLCDPYLTLKFPSPFFAGCTSSPFYLLFLKLVPKSIFLFFSCFFFFAFCFPTFCYPWGILFLLWIEGCQNNVCSKREGEKRFGKSHALLSDPWSKKIKFLFGCFQPGREIIFFVDQVTPKISFLLLQLASMAASSSTCRKSGGLQCHAKCLRAWLAIFHLESIWKGFGGRLLLLLLLHENTLSSLLPTISKLGRGEFLKKYFWTIEKKIEQLRLRHFLSSHWIKRETVSRDNGLDKYYIHAFYFGRHCRWWELLDPLATSVCLSVAEN